MDIYLVWSNKQHAWWGPDGHDYRHDVWEAGRYSEAAARHACGLRTWEPNKLPPEVAVLAPESGRESLTPDQIRAVPDIMRQRIKEATEVAMQARSAAAS